MELEQGADRVREATQAWTEAGEEGTERMAVEGEAQETHFRGLAARVEDSGIIGSGASSTVRKIKLESDCQMLGNERMIEASEAVGIPHHTSWSMEDFGKNNQGVLGPNDGFDE
jgi:hypothetical protein